MPFVVCFWHLIEHLDPETMTPDLTEVDRLFFGISKKILLLTTVISQVICLSAC